MRFNRLYLQDNNLINAGMITVVHREAADPWDTNPNHSQLHHLHRTRTPTTARKTEPHSLTLSLHFHFHFNFSISMDLNSFSF
ncbi:hypothetical protein RIF29_39185 [Crotalaria pallida]|uniref:Uncharacterized protein n=1 Tax=Crotalaria pallida TaxID=3830 RepID=A0AAN9HPE5_CROPI